MKNIYYIDLCIEQAIEPYKIFVDQVKEVIRQDRIKSKKVAQCCYLHDDVLFANEKSLEESQQKHKKQLLDHAIRRLKFQNLEIKCPLSSFRDSNHNAPYLIDTVIGNDTSYLSILYFMLNFAYQNDKSAADDIQFNFLCGANTFEAVTRFFVTNAKHTHQLIPAGITLKLQLLGNKPLSRKIIGSTEFNANYLETLKTFSLPIPKQRANAMTTFFTNSMVPSPFILIDDRQAVDALAAKHNFTYLHETKANAYKLAINKVALIPTLGKDLGVFALEDIPSQVTLGNYKGESIELSDGAPKLYMFELDDTTGIDAERQRNWTALVNCTSNLSLVNINVVFKRNLITYVTNRKICQGEQLLIDYGPNYAFNNTSEIRFLKPTDSYLDSLELLQQDLTLYTRKAEPLNVWQANLLQVSDKLLFKIPHIIPDYILDDESGVNCNATLHAVDETGVLLPQTEQENITILMYACIVADEVLINYLLSHGANPNYQASIQGYTALHLLVKAARESWYQFSLNLISLLANNRAKFAVFDKDRCTPIHIAIKMHNAAFVSDLLSIMKNAGESLDILFHQSHSMNYEDAFFCSLERADITCIMLLINELPKAAIESYIEFDSYQRFKSHLIMNKKEDQLRILDALLEQMKVLGTINEKIVKKFKQNFNALRSLLQECHSTQLDVTRVSTRASNAPSFFSNSSKQLSNTIDKINRNNNMSQKLEQMLQLLKDNPLIENNTSIKIKVLNFIVNICLEKLTWLSCPYKLVLVAKDGVIEEDPNFIYLQEQDATRNAFHYRCVSLNEDVIEGEINLDTHSRYDLTTVLQNIQQQGHKISDDSRQEIIIEHIKIANQHCTELSLWDSKFAQQLQAKIDNLDCRSSDDQASSNKRQRVK